MFSFAKTFFYQVKFVEKRINLDLVSGYLIILVGLAYLSCNWSSCSLITLRKVDYLEKVTCRIFTFPYYVFADLIERDYLINVNPESLRHKHVKHIDLNLFDN